MKKEIIIDKNKIVDNVEVKKGAVDFLPVKCKEEYYGVKISNEASDYDVIYKYRKLKAPVKKGDEAGEVVVLKNGKEVFKTKLITTEGTERKKGFSLIEFLKRIFGYDKTSEIYK